jgi:hypothetical protein
MKPQDQEKWTAHQAVSEVMEQHRSSWQSIEALKSQYDRLVRNLKKIMDHDRILQGDLASLKARKVEGKQKLIGLIFPIISVLEVFASDSGDRRLQKLADRNMKALKQMNPGELVKYAGRVAGAAEKLMGTDPASRKKPPAFLLADYGVTKSHVEQLKSGTESYKTVLSEYGDALLRRKNSRAKLTGKIKENEKLLENKLDKMIHLFKESEEAFYNAYIRSRIGPPKKAKPAPKKTKPVASDAKPDTGKTGSA